MVEIKYPLINEKPYYYFNFLPQFPFYICTQNQKNQNKNKNFRMFFLSFPSFFWFRVEIFFRFSAVFVFFAFFFSLFFLSWFINVISVFRLWAEVFHVAASGAGQVKWQQVSEDLVPVNITCIQDSPECVFHITAYNSQVDKILDVRLVQPGK